MRAERITWPKARIMRMTHESIAKLWERSVCSAAVSKFAYFTFTERNTQSLEKSRARSIENLNDIFQVQRLNGD